MSGSESVQIFYALCICISVGDPVMKRAVLGPTDRFNSTIFMYLFQDRTWVSNVICRGTFLCSERMLFLLVILMELLTITV